MPANSGLIVPKPTLGGLPSGLREELLGEFAKIVGNYAEGRWEPTELDGGRFAEAAYSVCEGLASGSMPLHAHKPKDMVGACRALEKAKNAPRSVRILIPRMLMALYEVRNNRGVGHVGGDVDSNHMDATC